MLAPPHHPGDPKWKTRAEWTQMSAPTNITMHLSAEEEQQDLLKRFKLEDESKEGNAWGEAEHLPSNHGSGWGRNPLEPDDGGWGQGGW